ncbi:hypothetical protein [uncultured Treponema sp.]
MLGVARFHWNKCLHLKRK